MEHPALVVDVLPRFGFWRRLIAAFVDVVILLAVGFASMPLGDQLMELGQKGKLIGLAVSLAYYGILNSGLGGGGTIGKRLLGLRVVRRNGGYIALWRSLWRAHVYLLPFYLYQIEPTQFWVPAAQAPVVASALQVINVGGVLAIVYLYLFNARTRQSLHDLLAGTFVVRTDRVAKPIEPHIRGLHVVITLVVFMLAAALSFGGKYININLSLSNFGSMGRELDKLVGIASAAQEEPGAVYANANKNTTYFHSTSTGKDETTTTLTVTVFLDRRPGDPNPVIKSVADRVLKFAPDALGNQRLCVMVKWGYDIGIGSYWNGQQACDTPQAWHAVLTGKKIESAAAAKPPAKDR